MKISHTPADSFKSSGKDKAAGTPLIADREPLKKAGSGRTDSTAIMSTATSAGTGSSRPEDYLEGIQKQFPGAIIHIGDLSGTKGIEDYAQSHYGSLQIVLSPKALKRMMEDPEFKKECERLIGDARKALYDKAARLHRSGAKVVGSGIVLDEDGQISQWTASVRPENEAKQNPYQPWLPSTTAVTKDGLITRLKTKDGKTIVFKKRLNYRPARDLSRIAQAESKQLVRTTMSGIRASIYQLKSSGGDKRMVGQLVGQAEQVLLKARAKIKNLEKEDLLKFAHRRAEQENDTARAAHLKKVLKERRVKRRVREYTQIRDHYPTPQELLREEKRAEEWSEKAVGTVAGIAVETGLTSYLPSGSSVSVGGVDGTGGGAGVFIDITS